MTRWHVGEKAVRWGQRALPVFIVVGCVAVAHAFGFILCPMKRLLGMPCPTCGTTRAFSLLMHGDVGGAFAMQPLSVFAVCVVAPALLLVRAAIGKDRFGGALSSAFRSPLFWSAVVAVVAVNWAYVAMRGN